MNSAQGVPEMSPEMRAFMQPFLEPEAIQKAMSIQGIKGELTPEQIKQAQEMLLRSVSGYERMGTKMYDREIESAVQEAEQKAGRPLSDAEKIEAWNQGIEKFTPKYFKGVEKRHARVMSRKCDGPDCGKKEVLEASLKKCAGCGRRPSALSVSGGSARPRPRTSGWS